MDIPKRVLITRVAMCGGGLAYDVLVPVKYVPNYDGGRYTTIRRSDQDYVRFEDATMREEHYSMPLGWDRYQDTLAHHKAVKPVAFELAKVAFPELAQLTELPLLWATNLLPKGVKETHRDILLDGATRQVVGEWEYSDGKPVKVNPLSDVDPWTIAVDDFRKEQRQ